MQSLLPDLRHNGLRWSLVGVPVLAWTAHLTFSAAIVHYTCRHPEYRWTLHAGTAGLGLVCLVTIALSLLSIRQTEAADVDGEDQASQVAFLGRLAVVVGVANLLLITAEGILVPFLSSCA